MSLMVILSLNDSTSFRRVAATAPEKLGSLGVVADKYASEITIFGLPAHLRALAAELIAVADATPTGAS